MHGTALQVFTQQNVEFQEKIMDRAGLGDKTGLSDAIVAMRDGELKTTLRGALDESEMVLYDVVENLLTKTNTAPQEVCSLVSSCAYLFVIGSMFLFSSCGSFNKLVLTS